MSSVVAIPRTDSVDLHVAEEVRAWLGRRRISQQRVADHLGTTQAAVSRRLVGAVSFSASELAIVADLVGAHPGDFFPGAPQANSGAMTLTAEEERVVYALRASRPDGEVTTRPFGYSLGTSAPIELDSVRRSKATAAAPACDRNAVVSDLGERRFGRGA